MKRVVVFLSGALVLVLAVLAGCTSKPAAPAPATQNVTQNVSGTVVSINTPSQPGQDQIVVQTPQGQQTFFITPGTNLSYNNTACPIEDAGKLITQNGTTYNCTIVYDETYHAIAAGIWKQGP